MYLVKTPQLIQNLFPNFIWKIWTEEPVIYLTFDDGPIPEVTPWVLQILDQYNARATFFCVGDNIRKHPRVFQTVVEAGHAVGNHTFHHLNGWSTETIRYFHDVRQGARMARTALFRPPYGKLTRKQALFLQRHYNIVMWDVLSADFDAHLSGEQCLQNVVEYAGPGSIVVFHDSLKAEKQLRFALPRALRHFSSLGYRFEAISKEVLESSALMHRTA